jgi:hypothetical protein
LSYLFRSEWKWIIYFVNQNWWTISFSTSNMRQSSPCASNYMCTIVTCYFVTLNGRTIWINSHFIDINTINETRENKNRQYIYIVENIKFIYTSFDEFILPISQQVEMNYIFSDNVHILYLSCYFKSPKETVKLYKKSRNKRCSYREVRA